MADGDTGNLGNVLGETGKNTAEIENVAKNVGETIAKEIGNQIAQSMKTATNEINRASGSLEGMTRKGEEFGRKVPTAMRSASKEISGVNENLRSSENLLNKVAGLLRKVGSAANNLDKIFVEVNQQTVRMNVAFGAVGESVKDIIYNTDSLSTSTQKLNKTLATVAESGKLSRAEARQYMVGLSEAGVRATEQMELLGDPTKGALALVNTGMMSTNEVVQLTSTAMKDLGQDVAGAERMLLRIADGATELNTSFGRGVVTIQEYTSLVNNLQTSLKFFGADVQSLPGMVTGFARAAEQFREESGRGVTGSAAAEIGASYLRSVSEMSIENRAFFGQMSGMGSGLAAGERFRLQAQQNPGEALGTVIQQIQEISGGRLLSSTDFQRMDTEGRGEVAAQRRTLQSQLIQQFLGGSEQQSMAFLDLAGDPQRQQEMLEEMKNTKKPIERIEEFLKKSAGANQKELQQANQYLNDVKENLITQAGKFESVQFGTKLVAIIGELGAIFAATTANAIGAFKNGFGVGGSGASSSGKSRSSRSRGGRGGRPRGRFGRTRAAGGKIGGVLATAFFVDQMTGGYGTDWLLGKATGRDQEAAQLQEAQMAVQAGQMSEADYAKMEASMMGKWDTQNKAVQGASLGVYGAQMAFGGQALGYAKHAGNVTKGGGIISKIPGVTSLARYGKGLSMSGKASGLMGGRIMPGIGLGFGMWNDWSDVATGSERQHMFAGEGVGGQMAESGAMGALDALSAWRLGPAGVIANATSKVGRLGVEMGRLWVATTDLADGIEEGADRTFEKIKRKATGTEASSVAKKYQDTFKEIARANAGGYQSLASPSSWGNESTLGALIDDANSQEKKAMLDVGQKFFDAYKKKNFEEANMYMEMINSIVPSEQRKTEAYQELQKRLGIAKTFNWDTYHNAKRASDENYQRAQERAREQTEERKRRREEEERRTPDMITVNLTMDGDTVARKSIPYALARGLVAPGEGAPMSPNAALP